MLPFGINLILAGLVDHMVAGGIWMKVFRETLYMQETHFIVTYLRGMYISRHHLFLACGPSLGEEALMKNMRPLGNPGDMRNHISIHIVKWITFEKRISIKELIPFRKLIGSARTIATLTAIMIQIVIETMGLIDIQGWVGEMIMV